MTSLAITRASKERLLQQAYEDQDQQDYEKGRHHEPPDPERFAPVVPEPAIPSSTHSFVLCSLAKPLPESF